MDEARAARQRAWMERNYRGYYPRDEEDVSLVSTMLGALFCFLLFCIIVASIAYPLTMYKENPGNRFAFSDEKWWCYHCLDSSSSSFCGAKCW